MLSFVHFVERLYKRFVESADRHNGHSTQRFCNAAVEGGKPQDGANGKNKFTDRVDEHEAPVEEFAERLIGFAHAVDGGAAVVVLLPFNGQMQDLVVFLLEEITAE